MPDPVQEYSKNKIYNAVDGYTHIVITGVGITNGNIPLDQWSNGAVDGAGSAVEAWNNPVVDVFHFAEHVAWPPAKHLMFTLSEDQNSIEVHKVQPPVPDEDESVTEGANTRAVVKREGEVVATAIKAQRAG